MNNKLDGQPFAAIAGKLDPSLLQAVKDMGFTRMSPVQDRVLSDLPSLRSDCLVQAKTGTGKTAAYLLPALHSLMRSEFPRRVGQVSVLVLSPTRELAMQIAKECDSLTSKATPRIECHIAYGGSARATNLKKFMQGDPAILVATPGRLQDYLREGSIARKFSDLQTLILDEADTMLESGFLSDVQSILKTLPPKSKGWQGMCFSATVPDRVKRVVDVVLAPGYSHISTVDKDASPTHERVPQYHVNIPAASQTFKALLSLLKHEQQSASKIIVFGVTARFVALMADLYRPVLGSTVYEMHSRLSQNERTRTTELFKNAKSGVMFASDVIGRGMDFPDVDLVVQVGLPPSSDTYIHRVGRTARAGNEGRAVILLSPHELFFISKNRSLPIRPHPQGQEIIANAEYFDAEINEAMHRIDSTVKKRAYAAYLGCFASSGLLSKAGIDKAELVRITNDIAIRGMSCTEPPPLEKTVIGKMGLKGVPGLIIAKAPRIEGTGSATGQAQSARQVQTNRGSFSGNTSLLSAHQRSEQEQSSADGRRHTHTLTVRGGRGKTTGAGRGGRPSRGSSGRGRARSAINGGQAE